MTDQTNLLDLTAVLSEGAVTAAPIILSVTPAGGLIASLTTVSDVLTLSGAAIAGATVTIYDGATSLGAVTVDALGLWSYTTAPLSDGAHAFAATATVLGVTSAELAATDVTVNSDIGSFTSVTDDWTAPISVDGSPYYVENANTGSKPYALTELDDHTLQFTLKVGDLWSGNDSSRSEIAGGTNYAANSVVNVSYQLTVQPGSADPNLDWLILGQVHADDSSPIVESLQSDYPVFAFHLTSATGHKGGDYLGIQAFYLPTGSTNPQSVTSSNNGFLYLSPAPIVRGSAYSIQVEGRFQDNANGYVEVWINGVEVVDYHGPIGYGSSNYWKEGVYEGYTQTQPITVDYANTMVTSAAGYHDFTGTGVSELVWQSSSGAVYEWLMSGDQRTSSVYLGAEAGWSLVSVGDFNGDGTSDMMWQNQSSGALYEWKMSNGKDVQSISFGALSGWRATTGNFGGTSVADIVWQSNSNGSVWEWTMSNGLETGSTYLGNLSGWSEVGRGGDFNGDGTSDLLWQNNSTGAAYLWLMDQGKQASSVYVGNLSGWSEIGTGDFNGDGISDMLWQDKAGDVYEWEMSSSGTRAASVSLGNLLGWSVEGTGDYSGGGASDIVWGNQHTGAEYLWTMSNGTHTSSVSLGTIAGWSGQ